jgi:Mg2+ transporter MgtE
MVFISDLLHEIVYDNQRRKVGHLTDLVVTMHEVFPVVTAIVVSVSPRQPLPGNGPTRLIPWRQVASLEERPLALNVPLESIQAYQPRAGELFLARDVLDKQIVDTQGRRIVKVNDLKLAQVRGVARLLGADISAQALFRRLLPFKFNERLVTWNYVQPLATEQDNVKLTIPYNKLKDLHPADLADLIEQMHPEAAADLLEQLSVEKASDTLQEIDAPYQADIVEELDTERASDLLEAMPADDAADIIGDLSEERAEEILAGMQPAEAADVKELLRYDERTAGGHMNPNVVTLSEGMSAQEAIERLRTLAPDTETPHYLYVIDEGEHLVGVASLRFLVTAPAATKVHEIMSRDVIKIALDTDQEDVADVLRKYGLLAVPVVDDQNRLQGLVTVDDVMDVMHEEATEDISQLTGTTVADVQQTTPAWQAALGRFGWLLASLVGGVIAGAIVRGYAGSLQSLVALVFFIPLLLATTSGLGTQALAVAGRGLAAGTRGLWESLGRELIIGGLVGLVSGVIVAVIAYLWGGTAVFGLVVGASIALALTVAALLGALIPFALQRAGIDPSLIPSQVLDPLVDVVGILIYLSLATYLLRHLT